MESPDLLPEALGTSPSAVVSSPMMQHYESKRNGDQDPSFLSLDEFIEQLPRAISLRKELGLAAGSDRDPIQDLFRRLHTDVADYEVFRHFNPERNYTRNLVATDNTSYTLLLLCWNPGRSSPIHDHPCDGCWMRVLEGDVQECRYRPREEDSDSELECTQDNVYSEGGNVFIEDSLGLHKVGNPSPKRPAVTMHLYSPPFQSCRIWLDKDRKPCQSCVCNYSEYGRLV